MNSLLLPLFNSTIQTHSVKSEQFRLPSMLDLKLVLWYVHVSHAKVPFRDERPRSPGSKLEERGHACC